MKTRVRALISLLAAGAFVSISAHAQLTNSTLVENKDVANAQAVGVITTFMNQGASQCDDKGQNCHSVFGADGRLDYNGLQTSAQSMTGVSAFSYSSGLSTAEFGDANTVASQTGKLVLSCGNMVPQLVSGVAIKALECAVEANGDATMTFQTCTAPSRGNPIKNPEKSVVCSTDPAASNFRPPVGYVCVRPACDTEPRGSLNGWSQPTTVTWKADTAVNGSAAEKSNNGLGLVFYPGLGAGVTPDFKADSDNMTAVKIVQTFINNDTKATALGIKLAYRYKTVVSKEMMTAGPSGVPNPSDQTAQWDTILKLQGNALIPQYAAKYAAEGSDCLQQISNGISTDGVISVCDKNYTNESGVKPGAKTAQVAMEGQECGSTQQCLQEVVNTNTWTQTCNADVPASIRKCTTETEFTMEGLSYTRTRTTEACTEKRAVTTEACSTSGSVASAVPSLSCTPQSFRCIPNGGSCCQIDISCGGTGSVTVSYRDCCGHTYSTTANSIDAFGGAGVQFNWNSQSRLRCSSNGGCVVDFTDYYCSDPTWVIGFYPAITSFGFGTTYLATYNIQNACGAYEAAR